MFSGVREINWPDQSPLYQSIPPPGVLHMWIWSFNNAYCTRIAMMSPNTLEALDSICSFKASLHFHAQICCKGHDLIKAFSNQIIPLMLLGVINWLLWNEPYKLYQNNKYFSLELISKYRTLQLIESHLLKVDRKL